MTQTLFPSCSSPRNITNLNKLMTFKLSIKNIEKLGHSFFLKTPSHGKIKNQIVEVCLRLSNLSMDYQNCQSKQ